MSKARREDIKIRIKVPDAAWEPTGLARDETARLMAIRDLSICNLYCHLEAIAVKENDQGIQEAADPEFQSNLDGMYLVCDECGAFNTVEINGRDYVLVVTPSCR